MICTISQLSQIIQMMILTIKITRCKAKKGLSSFSKELDHFRYPIAVTRFFLASSQESHVAFLRIQWTYPPFFVLNHLVTFIFALTFPHTQLAYF